MHVVFVAISGDELAHDFGEDATVGQARAQAAALKNLRVGSIALIDGSSELEDDSTLLATLDKGDGIMLSLGVRIPWTWAAKVDGVVRPLDAFEPDPNLSILLKHFNEGNGGEGHGRILVSAAKFPETPAEVLAFLRGEPLSQSHDSATFNACEGTSCWAFDEIGERWRNATILCVSHPHDCIDHYTVEWLDGPREDGPEVRMLTDATSGPGYTTAMCKNQTDSRMGKGSCHNFALDFGYTDAEDAWSKMPLAPPSVQCVSKRAYIAAAPPQPDVHDPVVPSTGDDGKSKEFLVPWWDILVLKEVRPDHVFGLVQQTAYDVKVPADHVARAAAGLRSLVGASPLESHNRVQQLARRCKLYTHAKTVTDGDGQYYSVTAHGWDPLIIAANPDDKTIAFAFANGTD